MSRISALLIVIFVATFSSAALAEDNYANVLVELTKREAIALVKAEEHKSSAPKIAEELMKKAALYRVLMGRIMEHQRHFKSAKIMYKMALEFDPGSKAAKAGLQKLRSQ